MGGRRTHAEGTVLSARTALTPTPLACRLMELAVFGGPAYQQAKGYIPAGFTAELTAANDSLRLPFRARDGSGPCDVDTQAQAGGGGGGGRCAHGGRARLLAPGQSVPLARIV